MAWPPDVVDGQILTASHVNSIKNSVTFWQGDVSGTKIWALNLVRSVSVETSAALGGTGATFIALSLQQGTPNMDQLRFHTERVSGSSGDWTGAAWYIRRIIDGVAVITWIRFGSGDLTLNSPGDIRLDGPNVSAPQLRATNPGAGSKQFWYDPADGNRVKFAA
jgi:hypothetical protein